MLVKRYQIINKIKNEFGDKYKRFSGLENEKIFPILINTVNDPVKMNEIIYRNDHNQEPPTKVFLELNNQIQSTSQFSTKDINIAIGAFWGFVFQFVFNYENKEPDVVINTKGVSKASYFNMNKNTIQVI